MQTKQNNEQAKAHRNLRKPDFIGIGGTKCASSWLYAMLVQHPKISAAKVKEVRFFRDINFHKGYDWYASQLGSEPSTITGEVSPGYLTDPVVPKRMHEYCPDVKLFACLRNPVDRAYSHYQYERPLEKLPDSFVEAIEKKPGLIRGSKYLAGIKRYRALFTEDQIFFLKFCEVTKRPEKAIARLLDHLGLESHTACKPLPPKNVSGIERSRVLSYICSALHVFRSRPLIKKLTQADIFDSASMRIRSRIRRYNTIDKRPPELTPSIRKYLFEEYFADEVDELQEYTGLDLESWRPSIS
jgi:hypothetical protein